MSFSEGAPSTDKVNKNHDDGNHQENMDETSHGVGRNEPEQPQYDQNDRNGIEHRLYLSLFSLPISADASC
jgi:hypothetical protein